MKYVYSVYARFDNRPAGYCGTWPTKAEAEAASRRERMTTIIKREKRTEEEVANYMAATPRPKRW